MKTMIISSNCSGGGKTTFTLGLMKALKNRNYDVQGYKVGPDYIDTGFHTEITEKVSRNLDLHIMGEEGVRASFSRGKGDLAVVEGVMGLYDGKGLDEECSTYSVSKVLDNSPIILVITPKAQSVTLCAEINGIKNFRNANIVGVVLNCVSESFYNLLKPAIEMHCGLKVFGYVPKDDELKLESRHLGLVQSVEVGDLNKKIAIAYDEAFRFYYKENLELLEEAGEVVYFSPLRDKKLPENIDFLYLGGGYPEVFKEQLSKNTDMLNNIKEALENGLKCYAECGGLMYLTENIDNVNMVGFFKGNSEMTKRLNRFGYATLVFNNIEINCHEFHKSKVNSNENTVYEVNKTTYTGDKISWNCGYKKKNTLAGYPHIHFFGNIEFIKELLK